MDKKTSELLKLFRARSLAILGKNPTAKGSVKFSYQGLRLNAARAIPKEYAKRLLMKK